jgi:hypothetical protein
MNLNKYASFFHDGCIIDIKQNNNRIDISMESSELWPEWNEDNVPLSVSKTIKGKLHLEGVKNIISNHHPQNILKMIYDIGEILDFDISTNNKIKLLVTWVNYPPKDRIEMSELIEIEAEKIYWENIPNLYDPMNK